MYVYMLIEAITLVNNKTLVLAVRHEHMYYDRSSEQANENDKILYGLQGSVDGVSKLLWPVPQGKEQLRYIFIIYIYI